MIKNDNYSNIKTLIKHHENAKIIFTFLDQNDLLFKSTDCQYYTYISTLKNTRNEFTLKAAIK